MESIATVYHKVTKLRCESANSSQVATISSSPIVLHGPHRRDHERGTVREPRPYVAEVKYSVRKSENVGISEADALPGDAVDICEFSLLHCRPMILPAGLP